MNKTSIDHRCPNCRADLEFNPKGQNWICLFCRSVFSLEDLKSNKKRFQNKDVKQENGNLDVYKCSSCGAEIITDNNTVATFCIYCKNTSIIKERLVGDFELKKIIPFSKTKEDAVKAFKKLKRKHFLMPDEFDDERNISEIRGVYIPFWLFSTNAFGHITANCIRTSSYRSGDYVYTTKKHYDVIREGDISFSYIPNDGSKKFDDAIMNSIEPYNYSKLVDFSHSYLAGFYAEKYDLDDKEAQKIIDFRIKNTVSEMLKDKIRGYKVIGLKNTDIRYTDARMEYVFLPVWFLNIKYKDNFYTFAMNGDTGKLIGNIPVDKKKFWLLFTFVFVFTFVFGLIIFYFFIRSSM